MKKLISILLLAALALSLAACGSSAPASTSAPTAAPAEATEAPAGTAAEAPADTAEAAAPEAGKVLVVYYSASGNTARVANDIAEAAGADVFEIIPVEPYTSDDLNWTNQSSRVSVEHDNPDARTVELASTEVPDWDSYTTVFIGYPIWWGIAAWPVDGFVSANDFTGKTVIPFATSSSSGMGESGTLLAQLAGTGDWQSGQRFSSGTSASDVQAWVSGLDLG